MSQIEDAEPSEEAVEAVYKAITAAFEESGCGLAIALAAMCEKLASIVAGLYDTDVEAAKFVAVYARDIMRRVPAYRRQDEIGEPVGHG